VGLGFQKHTFKRLISYGSKVQGTYFLHYLRENVAVALLGPSMGPASVAMYRFAYTYARIPSDAIGGLARVHFRVYALCEPHSPQLASAIRKALRASVLLGALILGVLASAAIWSVPLIYSEKWLPALPIVWSLLPHVLADIALAQLVAMAQGQGKPGAALWFYLLWSVATWAVCGVTLLTGDQALDWIGWGQSLATVGAACFAMRWARRQASTQVGDALVRPLVAVTIGALVAYGACAATPGMSWVRALAGMGTFLVVTVLMGALLDREELMRDVRAAWLALRTRQARSAR
jgi:O-antigen/teichoic acid export membrane protein